MKQTLDRVTGRVTMYRMVTIILAVTTVAAVFFAAIGQLPYTPLELIASAIVALGATVISNRVFALVFRTRPHTESSVITGYLLFFLFWPSIVPTDLLTLALAAVLASASKYLLVWRGRHIFNATAAGATLIALLQLNSAIWWVATGVLLPFTLIGAFLVLYRTRRLPMGLLFVAVAATILSVRLIAGGQDAADAVSTVFTSYPVIFFAGFMLSEPLTLPPRRWQQLALAAIVGVLFTVPFTFGPIYLSFEFALLIGNALAFLVGQRRGLRLRFAGRRQLTPTAWEFSFTPEKPVSYLPGQYMELTVPHSGADGRGSRRMFSVASAPQPAGPISFGLRMPADRSSSFKRALLELEPGQKISATSVSGDFLLPWDLSKPVLLVAGGIGITPFVSQLVHDRMEGRDRDAVLVYSVSAATEIAYLEELGDERVLLVCPEPPSDLPAAWRWIGDGPITEELLKSEVPDLARRAAFVSGAPVVVNTVRQALRRLGVRRVASDYFSGY